MIQPAYVFDGRNLLDENKINQLGFTYVRIGKKHVSEEWDERICICICIFIEIKYKKGKN